MSFEDGRGGHKLKDAGGNKGLEGARKWVFSEPPEKPTLLTP